MSAGRSYLHNDGVLSRRGDGPIVPGSYGDARARISVVYTPQRSQANLHGRPFLECLVLKRVFDVAGCFGAPRGLGSAHLP